MLQCRLWRRMFGVLTLGARGHGLADEGEGLVAVEAAQLDDLSVEREAVIGEGGLAEADAAGVAVDGFGGLQQADVDGVEVRIFEVPELDAIDGFERDSLACGIVDGLGAGVDRSVGGGVGCGVWIRAGRERDGLSRFRNGSIAVTEFDFEGEIGRGFAGEEAVDVEAGLAAEDVLRAGEDVVDVCLRDDAEGDLAVDAAEGEVVDLVAEGRDVGALGGVELDDENVFSGGLEMLGELECRRE